MRTVCLLLAALAMSGCKDSPKKAWGEMHAAACDRDTVKFFARVDKTAITRSLARKVSKDDEPSDLVLGLAEREAQKAFSEWEDDIKKGEVGDWCGAAPLDEEPDRGLMHWTTPERKQKTGRFADYDGKLLMVELVQ